MDEDKISVLLDLLATFDTIDHQILSRLALQWFRSYLLDRNQSIVPFVVNNSASCPFPLIEVPQGLVLVPVLFVLYTTPLSDKASLSVNYQLFADKTQLQKSTPPNYIQSLTRDLQLCTDYIISWMCSNQLKLNEDKTEAVLFSTVFLPSDCLPSSVNVGTPQIAFCDKVRNLGFILNSHLTVKQHVIKGCQTIYCELKRISSAYSYPPENAVKKLVTSCVLSSLDFCSSLLMGTPISVI